MVEREPTRVGTAQKAYVEGAMKAVRQLRQSAPSAREVLLSGRHGSDPEIVRRLTGDLADVGSVRRLTGFATEAKQGAQGAALVADGLAGGRHAGLLDRLRLREASGTVLDHLVFVSPESARKRLELPSHG